jgi:NAD(P)-dependent dehydrogenase (short-subunit alcohol dehydrogenase family)
MDEYRRMFEVNFWGPMQLAQVMMPMLRQSRGRIINVTSASVYLTIPVGSAYVVSKVALKSLTQHLRMEMAPFGVQVTSLEPGGVATAMTDFTPELGEQQWGSIPETLRGQYRKHFRDGGSAIGDNFTLIEPDEFADCVWKKIITARQLKPSYLIGPKVAALPWMHRLLPAQQVQNIWARMFKARPAN